MFLSKIWFLLVALCAGVAVTVALVAPRPAVKRLAELEGQRLDRAQYAADQMLRADAHKWIDRAQSLGRDALLSESLDSASRGVGEIALIHKTVLERLRSLIPDPAKGGLDAMTAVDVKGRVVARIGREEGEYKDLVGGAEAIADALRGFASDDVWGAGGRVTRVAAAPVFSKTRDRIVGAVVLEAETGKRLANLWKLNLNVDIGILLRGKVVASTIPEALLSPLPELVARRGEEIAKAQRTSALALPAGGDRLLCVAAPFRGAASDQDAFYVLVGKEPTSLSLTSMLASTTTDDLKWGNFPWIAVGGSFLGLIGIGLFLQRRELNRPLSRMRTEAARLGRGELPKLDDQSYGGKLGSIARDVNAALERFTHAPAPPSEMAGKNLDSILGAPLPPPTPSTMQNLLGTPPPPAFDPPPIAGYTTPPPPAFSSPQSFIAPPALPRGALPQPPMQPAPAHPPAHAPPPPPARARHSLPFEALATDGVEDASVSVPGMQGYDDNERTVLSTMPPGMMFQDDAEEAHVRQVFADYVATKQRCGEPTESLSLEKFRIKLRDNRTALMSKYNCKTVRFTVYVKEGRAALKATPVRD